MDKHALTVSVESVDDVPIIRAAGDLDLGTVPEMRAVVNQVTESRPRSVVFDYRELAYLDSSGLGILVSAKKRLGAYEGQVVILTARPSVLKALSLSGLDQIIKVYPSEQAYRDAQGGVLAPAH